MNTKTKKRKRQSQGEASIVKRVVTKLDRNSGFRDEASGNIATLPERKETVRASYRYKPHGSGGIKLTLLQEFFLYMMFLRRGMDKCELSSKFFSNTSDEAMKQVNSVLRTWASAVYEIVRVEDWWLAPGMNHLVQSQAFTKAGAEDILDIGDCTNVDVQGSTMSELIRQQLHSIYYSSTCGKYCVCASKIGGCTLVSPGQGGPA